LKLRMMKMHTRGHGRCHEFHHGSVRAEGSSSSWKPWMREIEFNPQNPGKKKERILERNPKLLLMREEALVIVVVN